MRIIWIYFNFALLCEFRNQTTINVYGLSITKRLIYNKLFKRMKESNRNVFNEKVKERIILMAL